jgi:menaquinol-cytochrome c reductase iron-sulfur subunit
MSSDRRDRRTFLSFLTQALLAVIGLCLAVPAVAYVVAPLRRRSSGPGAAFVDAGPLSDLPIDQWRLVAIDVLRQDGWEKNRSRRSIWIRRHRANDQEVTVLSPICPHLGCPVNWLPDQSKFACPCHGGVFDSSGAVVSGPPPRAMDHLDYEVRAGRLWVKWQDFKIGVREQIAVEV